MDKPETILTQPACPPHKPWGRYRAWVQAGFLFVWLAPLGRFLHGIPSCVFHCYACPLSSFACPVGLLCQWAAMLPAWATAPWLLLGVLLAVGASVGSLVCGWACPFGFLQDLLGRLTKTKWQAPNWLGYTRYVVLVGLVLVLPWWYGTRGILFEDQAISFCRLCPAGALEAGVYYSSSSLLSGQGWTMSWYKTVILVLFLASALMIHRPWCRIFCPLGGLLALFNRFSLFHLRFDPQPCVQCNTCRSRCAMGVKVDERVNTTGCIRCLECTTCGSLQPVLGLDFKKNN